MQIRKSQLRKVIQEQVGAFFVCPQPLGTVGRTKNLESSLNNEFNETDINKDALKDVIRQVVADVEKSSHKRMVGEVSGVDSLKPNDPPTPEDEAEKDAADDVMEAGIRKNKKVRVDSSGDEYDGKVGVIHKVGTGKQKGSYVVKMPDGSLNSFNEDELVMEAAPKKGGRPRGAHHIENVRFWDLPESSLRYIINDASDAVKRLPMAKKAGKWADEVNDAVTVLHWRKKKGIMVDESVNTAPHGQGKEHASVIGTNETPEMGSLATSPKSKQLIKKMNDLVTKKLKFKTVEDIQPTKDGVAFIFGDKAEASKMAKYLKNAGVLGKVLPLAAGGGKRTMVSLKTSKKMGEELPLYSDYARSHKEK